MCGEFVLGAAQRIVARAMKRAILTSDLDISQGERARGRRRDGWRSSRSQDVLVPDAVVAVVVIAELDERLQILDRAVFELRRQIGLFVGFLDNPGLGLLRDGVDARALRIGR